MLKIISSEGKFKLKEVDELGNSIRILPNVFNTEEEAKSFMETPAEKAPEVTPEQAPESTPESTEAPEATEPEVAPESGEKAPE